MSELGRNKTSNNDSISDLILLIGTNPLPNYIVTRYMIEKDTIKKIHLVYSDRNPEIQQWSTSEYAMRLKDRITAEFKGIQVDLIPLRNIDSRREICRNLRDRMALSVEDPQLTEIHLNYTGGTKGMAVHVHHFLKHNFQSIKMSYLSPRIHKLRVNSDEEREISSPDLRTTVILSIDRLLELHNLQELNFRRDIPQNLITPLNYLSNLTENPGEILRFIRWCQNFIQPVFPRHEDGSIWNINRFLAHIRNPHIASLIANFNENPQYIEFLRLFHPNSSLLDQDDNLWIPASDVNRLNQTVEFIDGKWLEYYIADVIRNIIGNRVINDEISWGRDLQVRIRINPNPFKVNAFVIRGYQFFGIITTTALKPAPCKLKGFEILHRCIQLGGDESKAILICPLTQNEVIPFGIDLTSAMVHLEKKLLIITIKDWEHTRLTQKLESFIYDGQY